jgi:hypothetical protein
MQQRTPKAIQFPAENDVDLALTRSLHQPVKLGPAGLTATPAGIHVFPGRFPTTLSPDCQ